jgi:hypothetical protein
MMTDASELDSRVARLKRNHGGPRPHRAHAKPITVLKPSRLTIRTFSKAMMISSSFKCRRAQPPSSRRPPAIPTGINISAISSYAATLETDRLFP